MIETEEEGKGIEREENSGKKRKRDYETRKEGEIE